MNRHPAPPLPEEFIPMISGTVPDWPLFYPCTPWAITSFLSLSMQAAYVITECHLWSVSVWLMDWCSHGLLLSLNVSRTIKWATTEGGIIAPESSHAVAATIQEALKAKEEGKEKVILMSLSGHGHMDLMGYEKFLSGKLEDHSLAQEEIEKAKKELENLPQIAWLCHESDNYRSLNIQDISLCGYVLPIQSFQPLKLQHSCNCPIIRNNKVKSQSIACSNRFKRKSLKEFSLRCLYFFPECRVSYYS